MSRELERFWNACSVGNLAIVQELSGVVDVNACDPLQLDAPPLVTACRSGCTSVVKHLLGLEHIDVNKTSLEGVTALHTACFAEDGEVVRLLVSDPRVDLNHADHLGISPLWCAAFVGNEAAVKAILAASRSIDTSRRPFGVLMTAEEAALEEAGAPRVAQLIGEYTREPKAVSERLRAELRWFTPAAGIFAELIFLCEGLLVIRD